MNYVIELAAFAGFFVYSSFFEWILHKYLMHQPRWQYPFRAHALVHHGLFRTGTGYFLSHPHHLRKVRFAWWNAPLILILHMPVIWYAEHLLGASLLLGALAAMGVYYFLYEYLHYCMHVPKGRWFEKVLWFRWLDSHHHMHHMRPFNNLNVVLPLADILFGTLIPAGQRVAAPDRATAAAQVKLMLS